jgi:hypothetical protein
MRFQVSVFSAAAGQKNSRSNRKRNSEKANIEYQMSKQNNPPQADRRKVF